MTILSNTLADRELNTSDNTRWPSPHHNFVPEYQQSGIPFAKKVASDTQITFPSVTRWISISCDVDCYINFNQTKPANISTDTYSFYIPAKTITRFELKCKVVNVKSSNGNDVFVLAGLTNIPPKNFPDQTSDNGFTV
jgi:hypothetical protein